MTDIIKYSLCDPDVNIMIIENAYIHNNVISIDPDMKKKIFLPTMYQSWTEKQVEHIKFNFEKTDDLTVKNSILYIFDTWGTSSYYHLLIDHIIPVWITKHHIEKYLFEKNITIDNTEYLRISNNNYTNQLSSSNDIFKYFLKDNYKESIFGKFKYIIYGYCFTYKPLHEAKVVKYFLNYQNVFNLFINQYTHDNVSQQTKYIIFPERQTRNYSGIEDIYKILSKKYKVIKIDFGKYTIDEQIKLCSSAYAIIGCEGAAFSNQIFMKKGSLIISICEKSKKDANNFHSSLAQYMNHNFNEILFDSTNILSINRLRIINRIIFIIDSYINLLTILSV
jgi:hypothetical protein